MDMIDGVGAEGVVPSVDRDPVAPHPVPVRERVFTRQLAPEIPVLLRVARTLTGSWSDAEDLVQETLVRAWRGCADFDGAHPRAWLLTILRRTHLNMVRRRRPDLLGPPEEADGHRPAFGPARSPRPEDRVMDQTFSAAVERSVAGLKPGFRTVLLLVDVDQLTYAEAAHVLDIPVGTVVSRLFRARGKVRRGLHGSTADRSGWGGSRG